MRIRWTPAASDDLRAIGDYIQERDGERRARQIVLRIFESVGKPKEMPNRGRRGRIDDTRELVLASLPFLAVYRVNGRRVDILRILHGAQKWP